MDSIEVYGEPPDRMLQLLEQKARALGEAGRAVVGRRQAGFGRFDGPTGE